MQLCLQTFVMRELITIDSAMKSISISKWVNLFPTDLMQEVFDIAGRLLTKEFRGKPLTRTTLDEFISRLQDECILYNIE